MNDAEFTMEIDDIPHNGWWKPDSRYEYQRLGGYLVQLGLSREQALEVLERAYGAAAAEFGS
jgi:hypothetical protein